MSFSNVAVGSNALPACQFDYSHDIESTANFGEVSPTCVKILPTQGKFRIKTTSLTRLSPMVAPVFGRMYMCQYHQFVRISDLMPSFPDFLAQTEKLYDPTNGSVGLINQIPSINSNVLMHALLCDGRARAFAAIRNTGSLTADSTANSWSPVVSNYGDKADCSMLPHKTQMFNCITTPGQTWPTISNVSQAWNPTTNDFTAYIPKGYAGFNGTSTPIASDRQWNIKLTQRGLRLYKIFLGCGLKPTFLPDFKYSVLPLLAYYKAYFDIFKLPQFMNWQDTACYRLCKWYEVNGSSNLDLMSTSSTQSTLLGVWMEFFKELNECWYTANADFVSAHEAYEDALINPLANNPQILLHASNDLRGAKWVDGGNTASENYDGASRIPSSDSVGTGVHANLQGSYQYLTHLDNDLLMKMYYWCNQKSQIGNEIASILKSKGYGQYVDSCKSCFIGNTKTPITVSEVISTADTQDRSLGDYAGQASKFAEGKTFKYRNDEPGYVVSMVCIIPEPRQTMALDMSNLGIGSGSDPDVYPFFNPLFEGLGKVASPRAVCGSDERIHFACPRSETTSLLPSSYKEEKDTFGIRPPFMEYKVGHNIRSGAFALQSQRNTFAPWILDKLVFEHEGMCESANSTWDANTGTWKSGVCCANANLEQKPNAGAWWRYPARYDGIGNYNRIFYDGVILDPLDLTSEGADKRLPNDNFMYIINYEFIATQNMLPVSRSWDTMDEEQEKTGAGTFNANK